MLNNRSYTPFSIPQTLIKQLESQKQQLSRIRQQQHTISSIDENLRKKNQQILRLKSLVDKYEPYHKKYAQLSYDYAEKLARLAQKQKQVNILLKQVDELIKQSETVQSRFMICDQQRTQLIRQQREIQRVNHEIEQTFKLYQEECKKKEMGLLRDLEKAYKQITELNKRIDEYEMKVFENEELRRKLSAKADEQSVKDEKNKKSAKDNELSPLTSKHLLQLKQQNQQLTYMLGTKQDELTKYKILNQQLSIEFDKSVGKICDFEKQLTQYRQENHELQKMLNLFVEKEKYQKMHLRQLERVNARNVQSNLQRQHSTSNEFQSGQRRSDNGRMDSNGIEENQ